MGKAKSLGCKFCPHYYVIFWSGGKHKCLLKPEYVLDLFSKRKPKWCPLREARPIEKEKEI